MAMDNQSRSDQDPSQAKQQNPENAQTNRKSREELEAERRIRLELELELAKNRANQPSALQNRATTNPFDKNEQNPDQKPLPAGEPSVGTKKNPIRPAFQQNKDIYDTSRSAKGDTYSTPQAKASQFRGGSLMDSIPIILNALTATLVTKNQTKKDQEITDTYNKLKTLIRQKFVNNPDALIALEKFETKPEIWREPLKDELEQVHADQDQDIVEVAQNLLEKIKPQQEAEYELIKRYYQKALLDYENEVENSRNRYKRYLIWGSITIGTAFIIGAIFVVFNSNIIAVILGAFLAGILGMIGTFFPQLNSANEQKETSFERLVEVEKYYQALELVKDIDTVNQKPISADIIKRLLEANNIPTDSSASSQQ